MRIFLTFLITIALFPLSAGASTAAERLAAVEKEQETLETENRTLREEIAATAAAQKEAPAPAADKEKPLIEVTPYGFIELIGWANDSLFVGNDLTLYVKDRHQSTTGMTAKGSRIGLRTAFPRIEAVKLSAVVEVDFVANMADTGYAESYPMVRMRHAYGTLTKTWNRSTLSFKAGQTWVTAIPNIFPAHISPAGGWATGNLWQRMPLAAVAFTQRFADSFAFTAEVAAARAMTGASANRNGFLEVNIDAGDASHIPQLQGQLSLSGSFSDIDLLIAVGGAWGRESYKAGVHLNNNKSVTYTGGIVDVGVVSGAVKLAHRYGEVAGKFYWGQNLDVFGFFGGSLLTENIDATTKRVVGSQRGLGFWTQVSIRPVEFLSLHVGYGSEDPDEEQKGARPLYHENASLWVSAFYTLFERICIGLQWQRIETHGLLDDKTGSRESLTGNAILGNIKLIF